MTKPKPTRKGERSYYTLAMEQIAAKERLRDKFVGALMVLVYDGVITDARARELIAMDIYTWRREMARVSRKFEQEPI